MNIKSERTSVEKSRQTPSGSLIEQSSPPGHAARSAAQNRQNSVAKEKYPFWHTRAQEESSCDRSAQVYASR